MRVSMLRLMSIMVALLMFLAPTRFDLVAAAVAGPASTVGQRLGFTSAKPYMATILRETGGRGVQLDKAMAMVGPESVDLVIPTTTMGAISLRVDKFGNVLHRASVSIVEAKGILTATATEDGVTTAVVSVEQATSSLISGWAIRDGVKVDLTKEPVPVINGQPGACMGEWFGCVLDCFGSYGAPNAILTLLAYVCGTTCERNNGGISCLVCISTTAITVAWMLGTCLRLCGRHLSW